MSDQPPDPNPTRVGRLDTLGDVRNEAARLYRAARRGDVPASMASKLTPLLTLIAKIIEGDTLERRLADLEARLGADRP